MSYQKGFTVKLYVENNTNKSEQYKACSTQHLDLSTYYLRYIRPSVFPPASPNFQPVALDGISWNLILGTFTIICREIQNLVKSGKNIGFFT
jgi:hypothetical protein